MESAIVPLVTAVIESVIQVAPGEVTQDNQPEEMEQVQSSVLEEIQRVPRRHKEFPMCRPGVVETKKTNVITSTQ